MSTSHTRPGLTSGLLAYIGLVFLMFPMLAAVPVSFTPKRFLSLPTDEWSLRHYRSLVEEPQWLNAVEQSILIALVSSTLATILATLFGIGLWYLRPRLTKLLVGLVVMPMAVPPVVSAMVMYFFTTQLDLFDSIPGVVLTHVVIITPFAVVPILVVLSQLDRRLEQAARNLGASIWQTTFWVVVPGIRTGIFAAWFLALVLSWEEIALTLFVTSLDVVTLPRLIWTGIRDNVDPATAAVSVVLTSLTVLVILGRTVAEAVLARRRAQRPHG